MNGKTNKEIYILGVGRNTVTVIDLAEDCGYTIAGLLHYNHDRIGEKYHGYEIVGCFEDTLSSDEQLDNKLFALSMGDLIIRKQLFEQITARGGAIPTLIHPSAIISRRCKIGHGIQIMPGSIIQGDSIIGDNTVITVNTVIAHSSSVGNNCLISGNVMVGAYTHIGDLTHIGQGSTIVSGKACSVGKNCILGAGSILLTQMPDNTVFVGNPAKQLIK